MRIVLEVVEGPHCGRSFTFEGHDNFIVGRARCAHFRLASKDPKISRVHFMVEVNPPSCRVLDMGSRNGTRVNGRRIQAADLRHGDLIQCGYTVLKVSVQRPPEEARGDAARPSVPSEARPAASDDLASSAPRETAGYRIVRRLHRPGTGKTYLAIRPSDGAEVALKMIRPAFDASEREAARLLDDARRLSGLRHPNLVGLHEATRVDDLFCFVMDYVPGDDAATLLVRSGPLPIGRAVRWACDVIAALQHAHDHGFVHGGVKPANWLVTGAGEQETCKLADFGLGKIYDLSPMSGLTMLGDPAGTLPYIPPEQVTEYRASHPEGDQYSTGATLYRLLTDAFLLDFDEVPAQHRLVQVIFDPPVPIQRRRPEIPHGLAAAIHRALEKDPAARFPSIRHFGDALAPYRGERACSEDPDPPADVV